jgi:nitrogen fixation NifU-like protein
MEDPDGVGPVGDTACGDLFVMYIRVRQGRLTEISYEIFGCPAAIATCEAVVVMTTGKTFEEAQEITDATVAESLGGLPEPKLHCSNSAAEALHRAITDYWTRQGRARSQTSVTVSVEQHPCTKKEVEDNATR